MNASQAATPTSQLGFGFVEHSRYSPKRHAFKYSIFYPLVDLDTLPQLCEQSKLWANEQRGFISFYRSDHFGDASQTLKQAVQQEVLLQTGIEADGAVLMLAQPRYLGAGFNPISLFFCYNKQNDLIACLAEVKNIPWGATVCYAMSVEAGAAVWRHSNAKQLHVSPFMPLDMEYRWVVRKVDEHLTVHIENWQEEQKVFSATLSLQLKPMTVPAMNKAVLKRPLTTLKIVGAIHLQAFRLWLKGLKYIDYPHDPDHKHIR